MFTRFINERRLLQQNQESEKTFLIPTMQDLQYTIGKAKDSAIALASECKMNLSSYDDKYLMQGAIAVINDVIANDLENEEVSFSDIQQNPADEMDSSDLVQTEKEI